MVTEGYKGRFICSFLWHSARVLILVFQFFFLTCLEYWFGHCFLCIGGEVEEFSSGIVFGSVITFKSVHC